MGLCNTNVGGKSVLDDPYWRLLILHPQNRYFENENNLHQKESFNLPPSISSLELSAINKIVTQFLNVPTSQIWSQISDISPSHPFVFFHQRKAGGTSLRNALNATAGNLSTFIAGFRGAPGDVYNVPFDKPHAVYAGHFQWGLLDVVARHNRSIREDFSCMTNFRHPIKRIESCIYYRFREFLRQEHVNCIDELPFSTFAKLLSSIDEYGHSCLNEPFRILSGINDETVIDQLLQNNQNHTVSIKAAIMQLTLEHLQKCPPIVQEIYPSFDAMNRRYPLFEKHETFSDAIVANVFSRGCAPLHGEALTLVENVSALEMLLYDAVFRKTAQHLSVLHNKNSDKVNNTSHKVDNSESEHVLHMTCRSQFAFNVREQRLVTQNDYFYVQKPKLDEKNATNATVANNVGNVSDTSETRHTSERHIPVLFIADNMRHIASVLDTVSVEDFFHEVVELGSGASAGDWFVRSHPVSRDTSEVELLAVETRPRKCSATHDVCVLAHPAFLSRFDSNLSSSSKTGSATRSVSRHMTVPLLQVSPTVSPEEVLCRDTNKDALLQMAFQKVVVVLKDPFVEYFLLIRDVVSRHASSSNHSSKQKSKTGASIAKEIFSRVSVQAQWQRLCVARHSFSRNTDDVLYDAVFQRFVSRHVYNLLFAHNGSVSSGDRSTFGQFCSQFSVSRHVKKTSDGTSVSPKMMFVSFEAILTGLDAAHRDTLLTQARYNETLNKLVLQKDANSFSARNDSSVVDDNVHSNGFSGTRHSQHIRSRHSGKRHSNNNNNNNNINNNNNNINNNMWVSSINRQEMFFRRLSADDDATTSLHRFFSFLLNQPPSYLENTEQFNLRLGCVAPNLTLKKTCIARHMRMQEEMHVFYLQHREVFEVVLQDIQWVISHWMRPFEKEAFLFSFSVTK